MRLREVFRRAADVRLTRHLLADVSALLSPTGYQDTAEDHEFKACVFFGLMGVADYAKAGTYPPVGHSFPKAVGR